MDNTVILPPWPPKCLDYRREPLHPARTFYFSEVDSDSVAQAGVQWLECNGAVSAHRNLHLPVETRVLRVGQASLELPISADLPILASQSSGITGSLTLWPRMERSWLTATSAFWFQVILLPPPPEALGLQSSEWVVLLQPISQRWKLKA
ncbi:hypothetical protein AAY473_033627 [Plecturocebus cupreus]